MLPALGVWKLWVYLIISSSGKTLLHEHILQKENLVLFFSLPRRQMTLLCDCGCFPAAGCKVWLLSACLCWVLPSCANRPGVKLFMVRLAGVGSKYEPMTKISARYPVLMRHMHGEGIICPLLEPMGWRMGWMAATGNSEHWGFCVDNQFSIKWFVFCVKMEKIMMLSSTTEFLKWKDCNPAHKYLTLSRTSFCPLGGKDS